MSFKTFKFAEVKYIIKDLDDEKLQIFIDLTKINIRILKKILNKNSYQDTQALSGLLEEQKYRNIKKLQESNKWDLMDLG